MSIVLFSLFKEIHRGPTMSHYTLVMDLRLQQVPKREYPSDLLQFFFFFLPGKTQKALEIHGISSLYVSSFKPKE